MPSPASCTHAPPAPLPSVAFRCPPAPRSRAYRTPAHCHPLPGRPPCRAPPSPEYRPAAARTHWARLARIALTACRHPHPPMSPPSRSRAHRPPITTIARRRRLTRVALRRPHRAHRALTSASPPPISLLALRRPRGPGWQESHRMHPLLAECAKKAPSWQHPPEMHAFRDQNGNILALCIHFRAQSGDSGYMARESCRQGPSFASRNPKPRTARRCCQRRAAFPRQRPAVSAPIHRATCAPHPSRQPRGPTASRKQAEQHKQLNAGIKIGSPNGDPIEELFGFAQRLPDALQPLHQANELALSYLDHSTRQRLGGYVIGLSGNSFTVDLYAALVDHATSIAR